MESSSTRSSAVPGAITATALTTQVDCSASRLGSPATPTPRVWLAWFLGVNDVGVAVFDPVTGGGYDGLESKA